MGTSPTTPDAFPKDSSDPRGARLLRLASKVEAPTPSYTTDTPTPPAPNDEPIVHSQQHMMTAASAQGRRSLSNRVDSSRAQLGTQAARVPVCSTSLSFGVHGVQTHSIGHPVPRC